MVAVVFGAAAGCGFLSTRDPVVPPDTSCLSPLAKTAPENILGNHENAVGCKVQGVNQFHDTMTSQDFLFTLDPVDASELGLDPLSRDTIVEAFRQGVTAAKDDSLSFTFGDKTPEQNANAAFYSKIPYTFTIVPVDSTMAVETYSGTADIHLMTSQFGDWEITSWDDFNDGSGRPTWGRWLGSRVGAPGARAKLD